MKPTPSQREVLKELINMGVGRGADVLNTMLSSHVHLHAPSIQLVKVRQLRDLIDVSDNSRLAAVRLSFRGTFSGSAQLIFLVSDASRLVTALTGEGPVAEDIDAIREGTLCEIGNIVLNGVMGSIGNMLKTRFSYEVPTYAEGPFDSLWGRHEDGDVWTLLARTHLLVERLQINAGIGLFWEIGVLSTLLDALDKLAAPDGEAR